MAFDLRSLFRANAPGLPQPMRPVMGTQISRMFGGRPAMPALPATAQVPVMPAVSQMAPPVAGPPALTGIANALSKMPSQAKAYGIRGRAP